MSDYDDDDADDDDDEDDDDDSDDAYDDYVDETGLPWIKVTFKNCNKMTNIKQKDGLIQNNNKCKRITTYYQP